jgi:competence protein ComEA
MAFGLRTGAARLSRGFPASLSRLAHAWRMLVAWRWGAPLAKTALAASGLVLLAAIGRSAFAGGGAASPGAATPPVLPTPSTLPIPSSAITPIAAPPSSAALAPLPVLSAADAPTRGRATAEDPVILNQATEPDLRRLPGVGPKRAQAILALRAHLGRFRQVEDLLRVKGIGRATLKKLRPIVRLESLPEPSRPDAGGT